MVDSNTGRFVKFVENDFKLSEGPIPKATPGHVVIKIAYSTINPSDQARIYSQR